MMILRPTVSASAGCADAVTSPLSLDTLVMSTVARSANLLWQVLVVDMILVKQPKTAYYQLQCMHTIQARALIKATLVHVRGWRYIPF